MMHLSSSRNLPPASDIFPKLDKLAGNIFLKVIAVCSPFARPWCGKFLCYLDGISDEAIVSWVGARRELLFYGKAEGGVKHGQLLSCDALRLPRLAMPY